MEAQTEVEEVTGDSAFCICSARVAPRVQNFHVETPVPNYALAMSDGSAETLASVVGEVPLGRQDACSAAWPGRRAEILTLNGGSRSGRISTFVAMRRRSDCAVYQKVQISAIEPLVSILFYQAAKMILLTTGQRGDLPGAPAGQQRQLQASFLRLGNYINTVLPARRGMGDVSIETLKYQSVERSADSL